MLNHFKLLPFVVGIGSGIVALYFYKPEKQVIIEYPHPRDGEKKIYRDRNGVCYTYTSHEVDCDANEATLKDYPIQ
jgi:hypothetical protein